MRTVSVGDVGRWRGRNHGATCSPPPLSPSSSSSSSSSRCQVMHTVSVGDVGRWRGRNHGATCPPPPPPPPPPLSLSSSSSSSSSSRCQAVPTVSVGDVTRWRGCNHGATCRIVHLAFLGPRQQALQTHLSLPATTARSSLYLPPVSSQTLSASLTNLRDRGEPQRAGGCQQR